MIILEFKAGLTVDSHQVILHFGDDSSTDNPIIPPNPDKPNQPDKPIEFEPFKRPLIATFGVDYQQANSGQLSILSTWAKTDDTAQGTVITWQDSNKIHQDIDVPYGSTDYTSNDIDIIFDESRKYQQTSKITWQENDKLRLKTDIVFDNAYAFSRLTGLIWQEMIRLRQYDDVNYKQANELKRSPFLFLWHIGLNQYQNDSIVWDIGRAVYYRKSVVEPILPKPKPQYVGSTTLEFICKCHDVDSHNVILHFGDDDCIPNVEPNKNSRWWYIVNRLSVIRADTGEDILVTQGNLSSDRNSWCWSYSLTVPKSELVKLNPIGQKPVILQLNINGYIHLMLLENKQRSLQFASEYYTLTGRSPSALLDSPYSATRSFTQENERTSVQLAQAEIDRATAHLSSRFNFDMALKWDLIDELGWVIASDSLTYSGLSPIAVIKMIAESAGGFVLSEPDKYQLTVKPLHAKTFWDNITVDDYHAKIPSSIVTDLSTDYLYLPDYNGITLTNDKTGLTGLVNRRDTARDVLLESVNNPLFNSQSMAGFAKAQLAKAKLVEIHRIAMPLTDKVGFIKPADIVAFDGQWWGVVNSISIQFNYSYVMQNVEIERVNDE